jgi:teichuronic acid biosynthesis glycosyltransferase TuaC
MNPGLVNFWILMSFRSKEKMIKESVPTEIAMDANPKAASALAEVSLHVLMVSNYVDAKKVFPSSGVFVDRQVASLRDAGVTITIFDIGNSYSPFHIFRKWLELRRQVRRLNPHLIHGQYGTIVGFLGVFAGRPTVISFCGSDLLPGAAVSILRKHLGFLLSNLAALRAQGLICKSEGLQQALWWRRCRAVIIPNGVDLSLFTPGPHDEARKKLGWDLRLPVVLMNVGNDPKRKGFDVAEAAMKAARSRVPEAELHVISHVEPSLMPLYYQAADVFLCASRYEGSPNMVKEALACNLPVVSSPVGDVPARLVGVHPSAIVPPDPNAMGEALAEILLTRARSNGREHVAHLALDKVAQRVLAVYQSVLASSY